MIEYHRKLLIVLCLLISGIFAVRGIGQASERDPISLVRIEMPNESDLERFATLNIPILAQLQDERGKTYLIARAGLGQQNLFEILGFPTRVLDLDSEGAAYYLVFTPYPENWYLARERVTVLDETDQFLLASITPSKAEELPGLGFSLKRLLEHPVVVFSKGPDIQDISAITPDPLIKAMLNQVSTNTVEAYIGNLSGVNQVNVNGSPYTFYTRYTYADDAITKAAQFVYQHFDGLGLSTTYHYFNIYYNYWRNLKNVIAEQPGVTDPNCLVFLIGHLDDYSGGYSYTNAPGADDNASGTAGVMIAADILHRHQFACTIRYVSFTAEEQGYYGSYYYVRDVVYNSGKNVRAVINLDMIGYNGTISPVVEFHTRNNNAGDLAIANSMKDIVGAYQINLIPNIVQDNLSWSDHSRFWDYGYDAVLAMEDGNGDFTPYYHTTLDTLGTIDLTYTANFIRVAIASVAHFAGYIPAEQLYFPLIFR